MNSSRTMHGLEAGICASLLGIALTACAPMTPSSSAKPATTSSSVMPTGSTTQSPSTIVFNPPTDGAWPDFMFEEPFASDRLTKGRVALNQPLPMSFPYSPQSWSVTILAPPTFAAGPSDVHVSTQIRVELTADNGNPWEISRNVEIYFFPGNPHISEGYLLSANAKPTQMECAQDVLAVGERTTCTVSVHVPPKTISNFFWWVGQPGGAGGVSGWAAAWPGQTVE